MLIPPRVIEALLDAGVHVTPADAGRVVLHAAAHEQRHALKAVVVSRMRSAGSTALAQLERLYATDHVVLVAPVVTDASRKYLERRGWSWVTAPKDGRPVVGIINFPNRGLVRIGPDGAASQEGMTKRGPKAWGRSAIIRNLLRGGPWSQTALAKRSGVSQPRVSQVIAELEGQAMVGRVAGDKGRQWQVNNYRGLLDRWLDTYPGPGGVTTYWYHLDAIGDQAVAAVEALRAAPTTSQSASAPRDPVVSGDAAADYLAPYRRSVFGIVYCRGGGDLEVAGFTPAAPGDATLRLVVPEDPSVWPPPDDEAMAALAPGAPYFIADPLQVIWDVSRGPGPDADQAAHAVEEALQRYAARRHTQRHG